VILFQTELNATKSEWQTKLDEELFARIRTLEERILQCGRDSEADIADATANLVRRIEQTKSEWQKENAALVTRISTLAGVSQWDHKCRTKIAASRAPIRSSLPNLERSLEERKSEWRARSNKQDGVIGTVRENVQSLHRSLAEVKALKNTMQQVKQLVAVVDCPFRAARPLDGIIAGLTPTEEYDHFWDCHSEIKLD
jgi:chromosome segregation ATPase